MNEVNRLLDLRAYQVLDTLPEKELDDIIEIASAICDTPISLITFVDDTRQWFKAKKGIDITETPRADAFCEYALSNPKDLLIVEDPLNDYRFSSNPLVLENPHIRFYAGAPLASSNGHVLGTLCVIDNQPRTITESQKNALKLLAKKVMDILEIKKMLYEQSNEIEKSSQRLKELTDQAPGVIYQLEMSTEGKMSFPFISQGISIVHPYLDAEELKKNPQLAFEVVHPDDVPMVQESLFNAFKKLHLWDVEYRVVSDTGKVSWHWARAKPEKKEDGSVILFGTFQDITEKKEYIQTLEQIIYDISHVLRRPVATMLGLTDLIDLDQMDKDVLREMIDHIKTTTKDMDAYLHKLNKAYSEKQLKFFNQGNQD
ncbi:MAG TPA: GAF domain-containing protein [Anditalea sp.]|nr:GAF domain-containing protein [Anditalea sp.]